MRGFVLQPTYRVEAGRAVVQLYGRLEDGRSFLIRDTRQVPHFYVDASDAEPARLLGAAPLRHTGKRSLEDRPVLRVEVGVPADAPALRQRLRQAGVACHEADVRFAMRFLIDRGIRGSLCVEGTGYLAPGIDVVFDDPDVTPGDWSPQLSVLSLDIETDPSARRLLSVALYGCGSREVLLLTPPGFSCPEDAVPFASESELLAGFAERVRDLDPDVITGWNVVDFDLSVLDRLAARLRVPLDLGRGPGRLRLRTDPGYRATRQASIPGRVVLDGIALLRGAFIRMEDYGLDAVGRVVLGEGKTLAGHGRAGEILRMFEEDRQRFVAYNRNDARLALAILEKLRLVELAVERSRLTGMPPDRVSASIAAFDFLYLSQLGLRNVVAPSVRAESGSEQSDGGHVLEPAPGLHANVGVLDFKSLYPSVIRTFQIDPLNLIRAGSAEEPDPIVAPNGAAFRRQKAILTGILDELVPRREAAQRASDAVTSQAIKILMNSFYGVLGTSACRFHDGRLANAITGYGRELLLWCKERIEARGQRVLYGDTDSLFFELHEENPARAVALGEALAAQLTQELSAHISIRWRVESRLELRFERLYRRLYLPAIRHGTLGARKRYAGLVDGPEGPRVLFTGMEAVRGDWTDLAREVQRELFGRLFRDQPVEDYLRDIVEGLRAGRFDSQLAYRKSLRKAPAAYLATTPPHVAAARKLQRRGRGRISYLMTVAGPEPEQKRHSAIDYEHYVQKQVRPIAEQILALSGLDFARVVGDDRQLTLF